MFSDIYPLITLICYKINIMENIKEKYKSLQRQIRLDSKPEIWKDIPWFEWLYQASNLGRIWSFKNNKWGLSNNIKVLKQYIGSNKAYYIKLNWKNWLVHRLIWFTFLDRILDKNEINHKNWIRYDNRLENLEWCSASENMLHSYRVLWTVHSMLWKFWIKNHNSKKVIQYNKNLEFIKIWDCIQDIERELHISHWNITSCCKENRNTAWWFIWKYFK